MARRLDERRPPEARLVLEGPVLEQLRHGTRITPDGQRVDVTPPGQRPGAERAFGWNPRDLELSLEQLRERFGLETWAVFSRWAADTEIADGVTVYQWLSQPAVLSRAPAELETWRKLGRPEVRAWPDAPLAEMDAAAARHRLEAGVSVTDPTGQSVHFTAALLRHWELEANKRPEDILRRLQLLPSAEATVHQPIEVWNHGRVRVYLRRAGEDYVVAVFAPSNGEVRTYFSTRNLNYVNRLRRGTLLWKTT